MDHTINYMADTLQYQNSYLVKYHSFNALAVMNISTLFKFVMVILPSIDLNDYLRDYIIIRTTCYRYLSDLSDSELDKSHHYKLIDHQ